MAGTTIHIISGRKRPVIGSIGITMITIIDLIERAKALYPQAKVLPIKPTKVTAVPGKVSVLPKTDYIGGAYLPADLTADSEPDFDNWGPDDYWSCAAFMTWHQLMEQKYGQAQANLRFGDAMEIAFTFGSYHQNCAYDQGFRDYFRSKGIKIDTVGSLIVMTLIGLAYDGADIVKNISTSLGNVTEAAKNTTSVAKVLLPVALVGGSLWAVDKFVYPIFGEKSRNNERP